MDADQKDQSHYGATVRAFAFDGEESKFRAWEGKTIALASAKGYLLALTTEPRCKVLTVEEFEYGEVVVDVTSDKSATPPPAGLTSTVRETTSVENRRYLARAAAWTYLVSSCTGKAYALIEPCQGDPVKAWKVLQAKYCATDAEENYPELAETFAACNLVGTKEDPELWFNNMEHLNNRIGKINERYRLDDLQLKSHIMTSMCNQYSSVVVKFRGDLAETPIDKLKKEIVLQYKSLLKSSSNKVMAATVGNSKTPKKFKGTCKNCGKVGHKKADCQADKKEDGGASGMTEKASKDKSHVM